MKQIEIIQSIDHTLLKPTAVETDLINLCKEAQKFSFATVCINPAFVSLAKEVLAGSATGICTVIGFPLGANTSLIKGLEAEKAARDGADELDMVINIQYLKNRQFKKLAAEIETVVEASRGKVVKVILETCFLTDEEKVQGAQTAVEAGARFVKTSTGFGTGGATIHDVRLLRRTVGDGIGVKASGGIRSYRSLLDMLEAGANRIGTSSGVEIVKEMEG